MIQSGSIPAHTGKPCFTFRYYRFRRSIPAHTGKPDVSARYWRCPCVGLSPHIRGNHQALDASGLIQWVYPRTYGETGTLPALIDRRGVYPRTYGETGYRHPRCSFSRRWGLSPHIRGNPALTVWGLSGERAFGRVYPRTYGETRYGPLTSNVMGLSPHIRGNHSVYPRTYGET